MAKFGYYRLNHMSLPTLIEEFEGTGMRKDNAAESVTIYQDMPDERREEVVVIRLNKGEWVAKVLQQGD